MIVDLLSWLVVGTIAGLAITQLVVSACYRRVLMYSTRQTAEEDVPYQPKAAVILAVRGRDPYLRRTLTGLLQQRYPDYTVFVVVDSEADPAMAEIREILDQTGPGRLTVHVLRDRKATCSLKCSALIQALEQLDESYQVVAFVDADAPPHPDWLRQLVQPLKDPSIGVVTGNRWFVPRDPRWGTLVRYLWNAGAVVQVWMNGIVWAGSMAMRSDVARDRELLSVWGRALSVDATVTRHVKARGLRIHFAPNVMMTNEEGIGLNRFRRWVERQLIAAKSSGSGWLVVSIHAFNLSGMQLAAVLLLLRAIRGDATVLAWCLGASIAAYWSSAVVALALIEAGIRTVARHNAVALPRPAWQILLRVVPAMILTHVVYTWAYCTACGKRHVAWRGIRYQIYGVNDVRLTDYAPFTEPAEEIAQDSVV